MSLFSFPTLSPFLSLLSENTLSQILWYFSTVFFFFFSPNNELQPINWTWNQSVRWWPTFFLMEYKIEHFVHSKDIVIWNFCFFYFHVCSHKVYIFKVVFLTVGHAQKHLKASVLSDLILCWMQEASSYPVSRLAEF